MIRLLPTILVLLAMASISGAAPDEEDSRDMNKKRNFSEALKVGDQAPRFTLAALHGEEIFELASHQGERPVVLFFGSYT